MNPTRLIGIALAPAPALYPPLAADATVDGHVCEYSQ